MRGDKLTLEQLERLLCMVAATREHELTCAECLDQLAEYAERELAGLAVGQALVAVERHLRDCQECCEEYQTLIMALQDFQ